MATTLSRALKTPITLAVLLVILIAGGIWGYKNAMKPIPTPPPPACQTQEVGANLSTANVTVNVLNGGTRRGLANLVAANVQAKGFQLSTVGNTSERITTTVIKGASADNPEVKLVAGFFKDAKIVADSRPDHTVDVLVGNDWPDDGWIDAAPTQIPVPGGKVCLPPPTATPTPTAKKS